MGGAGRFEGLEDWRDWIIGGAVEGDGLLEDGRDWRIGGTGGWEGLGD